MSTDYPRPVIDHFLLQAVFHAYALNVTNREAVQRDYDAPQFCLSTDELVRTAATGSYPVASMVVEGDGRVTPWQDTAWTIPGNRLLQFCTTLRYLASGDADDVDFVGNELSPTQVLAMADAWARGQRLFEEDASSARGWDEPPRLPLR